MSEAWILAFGDPKIFLAELPKLAKDFQALANVQEFELKHIRAFVKSRNYEISNEPKEFRAIMAAFVVLMNDRYAQKPRVRGLFRKKIKLESKRFDAELFDLFYRCVFEGLDLAPEGEALASL